ncbi:DUF309 domain-containing protein [Bacillus kwashiorkori]|uniref:DUF309 domain-containing protein n=1 Tax=Bacillus kwashiorkori TaxID=1522318 RepID=UPI0008F924E8|nr:DUF309 domain-containing protein [Bacillus kwashiorkori]
MFPKPLVDYLVQFHCRRDYFECHEILEDYWKKTGRSNQVWVGLIQVAVCFYHYRRGNFIGAMKLAKKANHYLTQEKHQLQQLGFASDLFLQLIETTYDKIKNEIQYEQVDLPIENEHLILECRKVCQKMKIEWHSKKQIDDTIIHRHKLR